VKRSEPPKDARHGIHNEKRFEMTIAVLIRQKDEELMNTNIKINELIVLWVSREETKMWKRIAKENELMASVFSNMPEEESDPCFSSTAAVPDEKIAPPALVSHGEGWNQSMPRKSEQYSIDIKIEGFLI